MKGAEHDRTTQWLECKYDVLVGHWNLAHELVLVTSNPGKSASVYYATQPHQLLYMLFACATCKQLANRCRLCKAVYGLGKG